MKFSTKIGQRVLEVETEGFADQASGASLVKYGDTLVLCTAQLGDKMENLGFFPLTCDYEERYYAAGKIGGSRFIRREGKPSTEAVLTSRMIDRAIRPLFPKELKNEVQVIATCLSWDGENDPDLNSILGASLSLLISEIPWEGPVGAVRVAKIGDKLVLNPTYQQKEEALFDLLLCGVEKDNEILINMIECASQEVSEEDLMEACEFGLPFIKQTIDFQKEIASKIGKEKLVVEEEEDGEIEKEIKKSLAEKLEKVLYLPNKQERHSGLENLLEQVREKIKEEFGEEKVSEVKEIFEKEIERVMKENVLKHNKRVDGRKLDEIRKIDIKVGLLPRTHGSALFSRGLTRILSILTLGAPGDHQLLEGMEISGEKRFFHHYNFPPYSVGETRRLGPPGRREIGHGMLAEKALNPLIPKFDDFPYTIRIVSEALSSNGSTSMASVCAASLALMDAGVPIKRPAAGIAIGLVKKSNKEWRLLTDIQGPEDAHGDMDFKVAGTKEGITAIQMDVKVDGLTLEMIKEALERAKKARLEILEKMEAVLSAPRSSLSPFAPRVYTLQINPEKIGLVIGSGGSVIKNIIENFEVEVDIDEKGKIFITAQDEERAKKALEYIKELVKNIEVGDVFQGVVKRIMDFGAMVEIVPGKEGLCHISELANHRIKKVSDVVKVGQVIPVKVIGIDEMGRISLSAKQAGFSPPPLPQKNSSNPGRGRIYGKRRR